MSYENLAPNQALAKLGLDITSQTIDTLSHYTAFVDSNGQTHQSSENFTNLLVSVQHPVETEIGFSKKMTDLTIRLIHAHDTDPEKSVLMNELYAAHLDKTAESTAQDVFMAFFQRLREIESTCEVDERFTLDEYILAITPLALTYLISVIARQGIVLPDLIRNEQRNGVKLGYEGNIEDLYFSPNANAMLCLLYDKNFAEIVQSEWDKHLTSEQSNYLTYYLMMTAYQVTFGNICTMDLMENLTGLNFGFQHLQTDE